jgi:hypothetical protein
LCRRSSAAGNAAGVTSIVCAYAVHQARILGQFLIVQLAVVGPDLDFGVAALIEIIPLTVLFPEQICVTTLPLVALSNCSAGSFFPFSPLL